MESEFGLGLNVDVRMEAEISSDLGPGHEALESSLPVQTFTWLWESLEPDTGGDDIWHLLQHLSSFIHYFIHPFNKKMYQSPIMY